MLKVQLVNPYVALEANNISGFTLQDINVTTAHAPNLPEGESIIFDDVEPIGTGSTSNSYTLPGFYEHHRDASLYTSAEIGLSSGTNITAIGYNVSSFTAVPGGGNERYVKVYIKETASTTLTTGQTWATHISEASLVYSGYISISNGWISIPISYQYQGSNMVVLIEGTGCTSSGGCSVSTYSTTTADNKHAYHVTDTDVYPTSGTLTANTTRPNIKIYTKSGKIVHCNYGISTYAMHVSNSSDYKINRCSFVAGNVEMEKWQVWRCWRSRWFGKQWEHGKYKGGNYGGTGGSADKQC